jgi:hypothetical protein
MRPRQVVLLTPSKSFHPTPLLSRQHQAPVSPLAATLMDLPASVANTRLAAGLNPLAATLTKNTGVGAPPCASDKDAHPDRPSGDEGFFSFLFLPLSRCRFPLAFRPGQDVPTLRRSDVPTSHSCKPVLTMSSLPTENCEPSTAAPVDIQRIASHNSLSAPLPRMAPITEEGE